MAPSPLPPPRAFEPCQTAGLFGFQAQGGTEEASFLSVSLVPGSAVPGQDRAPCGCHVGFKKKQKPLPSNHRPTASPSECEPRGVQTHRRRASPHRGAGGDRPDTSCRCPDRVPNPSRFAGVALAHLTCLSFSSRGLTPHVWCRGAGQPPAMGHPMLLPSGCHSTHQGLGSPVRTSILFASPRCSSCTCDFHFTWGTLFIIFVFFCVLLHCSMFPVKEG